DDIGQRLDGNLEPLRVGMRQTEVRIPLRRVVVILGDAGLSRLDPVPDPLRARRDALGQFVPERPVQKRLDLDLVLQSDRSPFWGGKLPGPFCSTPPCSPL